MKYILITATALFAFSCANAQMDKINSAQEKNKIEISKGEDKTQTQKENVKSDVNKVENTAESELKILANMSKEDIIKKMATMSKEEKKAFKAEVSKARAALNNTISKVKEAKKDLSNKASKLSSKGKEKQEKSITDGRTELIKKQGISKEELSKMESMTADDVNKLEKIEKMFKGGILQLPNGEKMRTMRGAKAVQEAISWVKNKDQSPALKWSPGLTNGCKDLVTDIGPKGLI